MDIKNYMLKIGTEAKKASFVTGQLIAADGGFEATGVGLPALRV